MFPYIAVGIALGGSALAGIYDLKTTEIPDEISLGMVAAGLVLNLIWSLFEWNPIYIFQSAAVGSIFFTFGLIMYLGGQWGGGDAKVLTGIGALVPSLPIFATADLFFPFSITLVVNTFLVGALYMIIYAVAFSIPKKNVTRDFKQSVRKHKYRILALSAIPLIPAFLHYIYIGADIHMVYMLSFVPLFALIYMLMKFLKAVEEVGFTKEIDTDSLQPGDMLADELEEVDFNHNPVEELKGLSSFLLAFTVLPVVMYLFGATGSIYFYMSLPGPTLGAILGVIYILYSSDFRVLSSVFDGSSTRIRGLEEDEVKEIQKTRERVSIREGVRFVPVFFIALLITIYYGNLLIFLF